MPDAEVITQSVGIDPAPVADAQKTGAAPAAVATATDAQPEQGAPAAADDTANQSEPTEAAEGTAETTEQQDAKKQSRFQRRLERQKTARIQAETEARLLRERIAQLEAQPKTAPQDAGEPKREHYEHYEDFVTARAEYKANEAVEKRLSAERETRQKQEQQGRQSVEHEKIAQSWEKTEKEFMATNKDYESTVTPFVEDGMGGLGGLARKAIVESRNGPAMLFYLAANPDVVEDIADLSPLEQVAELGAIRSKLTAQPKTKSNAPAPINPAGSGRSTGTGYHENMSDSQYREWRKKHGARWAS